MLSISNPSVRSARFGYFDTKDELGHRMCVMSLAFGVVLGFCPVALLKFWSTAISGPGTPSTGPHHRLKSGYEGVRDNRDFGQALLVA